MQISKIKNNKIVYEDDGTVEEFFTCICSSEEHMVSFKYYIEKDGTIDEDGMYISIHLSPHTFWGRVKHAVKYIFGYRCRYGDWEEIVFKRQDAERLRDMLNTYINSEITEYHPKTFRVKLKEPDVGPLLEPCGPSVNSCEPQNNTMLTADGTKNFTDPRTGASITFNPDDLPDSKEGC